MPKSKAFGKGKKRALPPVKVMAAPPVVLDSDEPTRSYRSGRLISKSKMEMPSDESDLSVDQVIISRSGTNKTEWAGTDEVGGPAGPPGPPGTTDHGALTDVSPDQHHPQIHTLDSHSDVAASAPGDGQRLTWDDDLFAWIPKQSTSGLGVIQLAYRWKAPVDTTPNNRQVSRSVIDEVNPGTPGEEATLYFNKIGDGNIDLSLFFQEMQEGQWLNLHDKANAGNAESYDITGPAILNVNVWEVPVKVFLLEGARFTDGERLQIFWRTISPDNRLPVGGLAGQHLAKTDGTDYNTEWVEAGGGSGVDHADLSGVTPDQHHAKSHAHDGSDGSGTVDYGDVLNTPPAAVPQTYLHGDLTDVSADQHHPQAHNLGSHSDVSAPTPEQGHILIWDAVAGAWIGAGNVVGENILINGANDSLKSINQRQFGGDWSILADGDFGFDRWSKIGTEIQQVIEPINLIEGETYTLSADGVPGIQVVAPATNMTITVPAASTGMKLEIGTVATPFQPRNIQQELAMCQRFYFEINFDNAFSNGKVYAKTTNPGLSFGMFFFSTFMRVAPVLERTGTVFVGCSLTDEATSAISYKIRLTPTVADSEVQVYSGRLKFNAEIT